MSHFFFHRGIPKKPRRGGGGRGEKKVSFNYQALLLQREEPSTDRYELQQKHHNGDEDQAGKSAQQIRSSVGDQHFVLVFFPLSLF